MGRSISVRASLVALLATTLACAALPRGTPAIEGTWVVTRATLGGKEVPLAAFQNSALRLAGGQYAFRNDSGEYAVIADAVPSAIDVRGRVGPNAGKTIPAIFDLRGDTLTICYDLSGKARPKDFRSDAGTLLYLARYTRAAP